MYSYLADITSLRSRTTRIGLLDIFLFAGIPSGSFLSAYIYEHFGYYGVFFTALAIQITCILYITIKIKDTRGPNSDYCYPESELDTMSSSILKYFLPLILYKNICFIEGDIFPSLTLCSLLMSFGFLSRKERTIGGES